MKQGYDGDEKDMEELARCECPECLGRRVEQSREETDSTYR
jgi:hypothetical protein